MSRKLLRAASIVFKKFDRFLEGLDNYIVLSRIGKAKLARLLGMPYKTFYRKLQSRTFKKDELEKLINEVENANSQLAEKRNQKALKRKSAKK